jgi:hypothetical protein
MILCPGERHRMEKTGPSIHELSYTQICTMGRGEWVIDPAHRVQKVALQRKRGCLI